MVEGIFRIIGGLFAGLVLGIFRLLGMGIGSAVRKASDKRMVAQARSPGRIKPTAPFIPIPYRLEHTHIVGGSGHGKTQLLQKLILEDLQELKDGRGSIVIIDSQGDMINKLIHLADMRDIKDRLVLIDPNNLEHPPALNLFDFGLSRLNNYSPLEKERLLNGSIALYEYLFGALLGADLTMRQGTIFRYLARLMMTIEGATIHTMLELIENPDAVRPHLDKVDRLTKHFLESQFFAPAYKETRQQIEARLWGVISNPVLERMFSNPKNKLDLFSTLNRGSLVMIITAKDLLKQDGCQIMGRFFIALIGQAIQERATIPEDRRRVTFLYVDEAHDYFDDNLENLINQLRKYKAGLIIAHQNLDQLSAKLRATVMASTTTKFVGGVSAADAHALAKEMNTNAEFIMAQQKHNDYTQFACRVRNYGDVVGSSKIPFGMLEAREKLTEVEYQELLLENAAKYSSHTPVIEMPKREPAGALAEHETL